jgi:hypothetical protein
MSPAALDKLIWALIFGGLLLFSLGLFVQQQGGAPGLTITLIGAALAVAGAVLIWVRSRIEDPPPPPSP